jgi:hypothetical protein
MYDVLKIIRNKFSYCEMFRFTIVYELNFYELSNALS